ncbi:alpha/beta fold hydrolase [Streptosporangium sp. NBC_01756]|uniref:alpha/beta fold hydrolase n=1 Tax=Streptosporangium sp. NBC_01756 TaxID=2975950 RepID=UPI002DD82761|nr:alpha/beta hydrolase [Streptosporangium sp. NBC_01756]WSC87951.1 alpha/beta hydrolase [Streptosporangium sp. NBC_01756]
MAHQRVCVLLPGMLCSERLWAGQETALRSLAEIVHLRPSAPDIDAMADQVLSLPYRRFALAGLSLGGIVAMAVARKAPERIERLALLSTNARAPRPGQHDAWRAMADRVRAGEFHRITPDGLLPSLVHPRRRAGLAGTVVAMADEVGPEAFLAQLDAQHSRRDELSSLTAVRGPALVVAAEQDALCPIERHEEIAAALPYGRLEVLADCGHLSPLERPRLVSDLLTRWMAEGADPPHPRDNHL